MLDPRRVLTFREVALHRSFSRAADALSLTQSAVSQQVAALERQAGTRLLERGRGGLQGHARGRAAARARQRRLRAAAARGPSARRQCDRRARRAARRRLPKRAGDHRARSRDRCSCGDHPGLRVAVEEGRLDDLAAGVRAGRLHLALGFQDAAAAPRASTTGLRRHELVEEPMVARAPAASPPRAAADDDRPRRPRGRALDRSLATTASWPATCLAAGFQPRIAFLASDPLAIRALDRLRAGRHAHLAAARRAAPRRRTSPPCAASPPGAPSTRSSPTPARAGRSTARWCTQLAAAL